MIENHLKSLVTCLKRFITVAFGVLSHFILVSGCVMSAPSLYKESTDSLICCMMCCTYAATANRISEEDEKTQLTRDQPPTSSSRGGEMGDMVGEGSEK